MRQPLFGILRCMHDSKYKDFRFRQIVKHNVRKSFDRPVTNAMIDGCTTFGIRDQLIHRPPDTCDKVRSEIRLSAIVPFSGVEHI